jgi:hypothetical protein
MVGYGRLRCPPMRHRFTATPVHARTTSVFVSLRRRLDRTFAAATVLGTTPLLLGTAILPFWERGGIILLMSGVLIIMVPLALVSIVSLTVTTYSLMGTALEPLLCIPRTLFFESQFHTTDLVFLVALLGNALGLLLSMVDNPVAGLLLAGLTGLWILGGAAWGLWTATQMEERRVLRRWWLMLFGMLLPAAIVGLPAGVLLILNGVASTPPEWPLILFGTILLPVSLWVSCVGLLPHFQVSRSREAPLPLRRQSERRRAA